MPESQEPDALSKKASKHITANCQKIKEDKWPKHSSRSRVYQTAHALS